MSVSSDTLYPPEEQAFLAEHLPSARYAVLDSEHGHDGFLIETQKLGEIIRAFRDELRGSGSVSPASAIAAGPGR